MRKSHSHFLSASVIVGGLLCGTAAHALWSFDQAGVTGLVAKDSIGTIIAGDPTLSLTGVYAANGASDVGFATNATWQAGALSYFVGAGQGMYSGGETTSPFHALDNNGNTEAVILQFGSSVVLSSIGIGYTSDNNGLTSPDTVDVSVFRWMGSGTPTGSPSPLVGQGAAAMTGWQLVGNYGDMGVDTSNPYNAVNTGQPLGTGTGGAGGRGSSWWMISAYNSGYSGAQETRGTLDVGNDFFKLYAVAGTKCTSSVAGVCGPGNQTPEPTSLALLGLGVLGVIGSRRRLAKS